MWYVIVESAFTYLQEFNCARFRNVSFCWKRLVLRTATIFYRSFFAYKCLFSATQRIVWSWYTGNSWYSEKVTGRDAASFFSQCIQYTRGVYGHSQWTQSPRASSPICCQELFHLVTKTSVWTGTLDLTFYRPSATTSSFSVNRHILMEMTLHGEESTDSSEETVRWRRNVKSF